jgi:hypothetical protein
VRVVGAVSQLVGVDHGEDVGDAEGLPDVALALYLRHVQGIAPDPVRRFSQPAEAFGLLVCGGCHW